MISIEEIIKKLKSSGYKITPQRLEIIKILEEIGHEHPSIKEIYEIISKKIPTVSFSTLYNIIQKLEDLGIVKTFVLGKETHIEVNTKPHINLISLETGEIKDVEENQLIREIEKIVKENYDKRSSRIQFINVYIK